MLLTCHWKCLSIFWGLTMWTEGGSRRELACSQAWLYKFPWSVLILYNALPCCCDILWDEEDIVIYCWMTFWKHKSSPLGWGCTSTQEKQVSFICLKPWWLPKGTDNLTLLAVFELILLASQGAACDRWKLCWWSGVVLQGLTGNHASRKWSHTDEPGEKSRQVHLILESYKWQDWVRISS